MYRTPTTISFLILLQLSAISSRAWAKDIRELNQHFNVPDGDISPWMFVPGLNVKDVSTTVSVGLATVWEAGQGHDIKCILQEPIRLDEYPPPWEFQMGLAQNFLALNGISNCAIGLNVAVTFSDPSTWPKDRTQMPPETHTFQLFAVSLANMTQFSSDMHPNSFWIWGRGDLEHTLQGNWDIPSIWIGDGAQYGGPASSQIYFRFGMRSDGHMTVGLKFDASHGWHGRIFNYGKYGKATGIWQIGPIFSCDRWIQDELCANLPRKKAPRHIYMGPKQGFVGFESEEPKAPDPTLEYYVDYCVFMPSDPVPSLFFDQYSDDFNIPGYMGQWIIQPQNTIIETYSNPGFMTWTLLGPSVATGIAPIMGSPVNLTRFPPPWEMEICFICPDDTIPWNFYMNMQMPTNKGRMISWGPGVRNDSRKRRHEFISSGFPVVFDPPVPETVLAQKPIYMLIQWIDLGHVRVGFKAKPEDQWILSKVCDYSTQLESGEKIKDETLADWTTVTGSYYGAPGCSIYQKILIDYIHHRYGLSAH